MAFTASLPMYNLPELREANAAFWSALRQEVTDHGLTDLPENLDFSRPAVPAVLEPNLIVSQVCGYPLQTIFRGQAVLLGTPSYDCEHCDGATHAGVFVVHRDSWFRTLADLAGCRFVFNSIHSNSGMNLPRHAIAALAGGRAFFGSVRETDGHPRNLDRVAAGEADATCVDCVTYALCCRYRDAIREQTRILAPTLPSPALPFVTSVAMPPSTVAALRSALFRVGTAPEYAKIRAPLMLSAITQAEPAAYARLLDLEHQAIALGYPRLM